MWCVKEKKLELELPKFHLKLTIEAMRYSASNLLSSQIWEDVGFSWIMPPDRYQECHCDPGIA